MKFIKYAVGLVIALSVIPLVVVAVNNLDQPKTSVVEFEVIDIDDSTFTISENTFDNIHSLIVVELGVSINLITVKVNDDELETPALSYDISSSKYSFTSYEDIFDWANLDDTNTVSSDGYTPTIGDKWTMTFEVPNPTPPLIKTLVGFVPLLLIGGVLVFMLNKRKLD